jgi:hypothetical protein
MKKFVFYLALFSIAIMISCNKKNNIPNPTSYNLNVTADIVGQVIDENGNPILGAIVKTNTHTCITDSDGFFLFMQISTSKNKTTLEVTKPNYFNGYRTMNIIANQDNYTKIRLIEKKNPSNFNATTGGLVQVNGGGTIIFAANSIVNKSTGAPYSGNVTVYSSWIDPTSDKLGELIPGALRGQDSNDNEKLLESYGMIGAELYDDNNQALQIASGYNAQITFPIPSSLSSNAPTTIPLWHFDGTTGMWKEEGFAQKQGNEYVGSVSHFSFWNCDVPGNFIQFEATFKNTNGTPQTNVIVKITNTANSTIRYSITNSQGKVNGMIPENANLFLELFTLECNTIFYSQNITTTTANLSLNNIIVNVPTPNQVIITGTILNCTNEICTNGYVKYKHNNNVKFIKASSNGIFFNSTIECITPINVKLIPYDFDEEVFGSETNYSLNSGLNNVGNLIACGNAYDQFVKCENTINGVKTSYTITDIKGVFEGGLTLDFGPSLNGIGAADSFTTKAIAFAFDGAQSMNGNHYLVHYGDHLDYDLLNDTTNSYINTIIPVTLTKYEAIGGKIEGSFNGNIKGLNIPDRNVKCTFRVNRTQ